MVTRAPVAEASPLRALAPVGTFVADAAAAGAGEVVRLPVADAAPEEALLSPVLKIRVIDSMTTEMIPKFCPPTWTLTSALVLMLFLALSPWAEALPVDACVRAPWVVAEADPFAPPPTTGRDAALADPPAEMETACVWEITTGVMFGTPATGPGTVRLSSLPVTWLPASSPMAATDALWPASAVGVMEAMAEAVPVDSGVTTGSATAAPDPAWAAPVSWIVTLLDAATETLAELVPSTRTDPTERFLTTFCASTPLA